MKLSLSDRLNGWKYDIDGVPINKAFLVYLTKESVGTRVHVAIKMKIANGHLLIVGGNMESDMPQILFWRPMVELPQGWK